MMKKRWLMVLSSFVAVAFTAIILGCSTKGRDPEAVACGNQMIAIGFGLHIWVDDNGDGNLPADILSVSNEIATPKILICPSDYSRHAATNWSSFTPNTCSYEMVAKGLGAGDTNATFLRCPIHGYVLRRDGAVFDGERRLKKGMR